jgi:hypothetical protein
MHFARKMFHKTEGVSSELGIFELDKCWHAVIGCVGGVGDVGGVTDVAGSIHINSTQVCFVFFLLSSFPHSSYHI